MPGWRSHTETDAWKLADQVRVEVYRLCSSRKWQAHQDLRNQLTDAVDSACANMAEGFARFYPKEHADRISKLADRSQGASTRLNKYLENSDGPGR